MSTYAQSLVLLLAASSFGGCTTYAQTIETSFPTSAFVPHPGHQPFELRETTPEAQRTYWEAQGYVFVGTLEFEGEQNWKTSNRIERRVKRAGADMYVAVASELVRSRHTKQHGLVIYGSGGASNPQVNYVVPGGERNRYRITFQYYRSAQP
jgi:hypothetical protein